MKEKTKGLVFNLVLYTAALGAGIAAFAAIDDVFLAEAALTLTGTLVIFAVTCVIPDTSLYDPYWSVAPPVMIIAAMIKYRLAGPNAVLTLAVVLIWSVRLTANWAITYKGLRREDWRYRIYREKLGRAGFFFVNLFGLQLVPTIAVYAGLVAAFFTVMSPGFTPLITPGLAVSVAGTVIEYIADTSIHGFLREGSGTTCDVSLWKYSRHPNYLGEITFWTGIFLSFLAVRPDIWYYGLGFLLIVAIFLFISIPMMEKHNAERRPDYAAYKERTPVLIPFRIKKAEGPDGDFQE